MVESDYQCSLCILGNPRRRCWTRGSRLPNVSTATPLISLLQVFSPAQVIFAGVGVLLSVSILFDRHRMPFLHQSLSQAAKDVEASQDALVDLFGCIESFFKRLESYTAVQPTDAMTEITVKIMVEVLNIFAIATKEMKQGRASASLSLICNSWLIYYPSYIQKDI